MLEPGAATLMYELSFEYEARTVDWSAVAPTAVIPG